MTGMSKIFHFPLLRNSQRIPRFFIQQQPVRRFKTRRTREEKTKPQEVNPEYESVKAPVVRSQTKVADTGILGKYFLYTAVSVPVFFTGCAIWQYENMRRNPVSLEDLFRRSAYQKPRFGKEAGFRDNMNAWWNQQSFSDKVVYGIIAANIAVFLLWKVRPLTPFMMRYFTCMPTRAHSVMGSTLSAFSHKAGFHLFVNMYVLMSLTPVITSIERENTLAVYLAGGTVSGLASSVYRVLTGAMYPSIGASGAVLTFIAMVCINVPDSRFGIAFVNQIIPHSFSAQTALCALVAFDCVGLLLGWRFLDHAGHLGGVLFGIFYATYGKELARSYKRKFMIKYADIRERK